MELVEESAWARVLRLSAAPTRNADALAVELAHLELAGGGEAGEEVARDLFKLAQELLKHKQNQVNALVGEVETLKRASGSKRRKTGLDEDSPSRSDDGYLENVTQQEEEIAANKEILEQLYADIAELEGRKHELKERDRMQLDRDSNSSREQLSELDAVRQLERQVDAKNRHIRKMLTDIMVLEEENRLLKEKVATVKEKLSEATHLIRTLTDQLLKSKNDYSLLKDNFGRAEEDKEQLALEIGVLKKKMKERDSNKKEISEEIHANLLHWKNNARSKKKENEFLVQEISKLKELIATEKNNSYLSNIIEQQEEQIKNLQEKLSEASDEIVDSVKIIEHLKAESKKTKIFANERTDTMSLVSKSEPDGGNDQMILHKMKRKIHTLTSSLRIAEETLASREQELAELSSQLQLLESGEEGVRELLSGLKSTQRQLKLKDVRLKSLVREVNTLSQVVDGLQIENEAMREKLQIRPDEVIATEGILSKFHKSETKAAIAEKKLRELENAYVKLELACRTKDKIVMKLKNCLSNAGICDEKIDAQLCSSDDSEVMPRDGGGESSVVSARRKTTKISQKKTTKITEEMKALIDENDGLRRGMEEILEFLKDNSTSTSGTLAVQCPSLEKVVQCLSARHSAGWYAPHMAAVMGLQAAIGGRDALLTALHQARKETFEVMEKLSKESEKSTNLELKLQDIENKSVKKTELLEQAKNEIDVLETGVFGTWVSEKGFDDSYLIDKAKVNDMIDKGNKVHEKHLKESLTYFHKQFQKLYQKMTDIAVQTTNNQNKWDIEEEKYKAEIFNLKAQLDIKNGDDASENSEGVVPYLNISAMTRKCIYLEESFRYIRTLNENIKNEFLESERQNMIILARFESQIQMLMLNTANLTDRLRNSVSINLFLKQNDMFNDVNMKYRKLLDKNIAEDDNFIQKELENQKNKIIAILGNVNVEGEINNDENVHRNILNSTEHLIVKHQLENLCKQYDSVTKRMNDLENENILLQLSQKQLIDNTLSLATKQEFELMQNQLEKMVEENKTLKYQCLHVGSQLEIALLQLQDTEHRHLMNDMEVNMLRHQVLDLQATDDNKAIIARLSGDILIANLQTSDTSKKIDKLNSALAKEKRRRVEAEEMLGAREKIFTVYAARYESRFCYMYEVMQTLRKQYGGALPLVSIENYLNTLEEISRKNHAADSKLTEVEDQRSVLLAKIETFNEILERGSFECPINDSKCPHEMKLAINQSVHTREIVHYTKKIDFLERSREEISNRCTFLEKTLVLVNQGYDGAPLLHVFDKNIKVESEKAPPLKLEDVPSDDNNDDDSQKSLTITLTKPQVLLSRKPLIDVPLVTNKQARVDIPDLPGSPIKMTPEKKESKETTTVVVQTDSSNVTTIAKMIQTERDASQTVMDQEINLLRLQKDRKHQELIAALALAGKRAEEILCLEASKLALDANIKSFQECLKNKEVMIEKLQSNITELKKTLNASKHEEKIEQKRIKESSNEETKSLLKAVKKLENDKNCVIEEYKQMLQKERDEYSSNIKECQAKMDELQEKLDMHNINPVADKGALNPVVTSYMENVSTLEDHCFKLQNALDESKTDLKACEKELERWKSLASERLTKIEQMSEQFEERHGHEVETYRAESQHWLSELAEKQKETLDLRSRLAEQRTIFLKQLTEKDNHIEQHKSTVQNLKGQILSMQSIMSASDPSFDLSAIAEVSETSDASPQGSERLEIRFHSTHELGDAGDESKEPSVMSPTWQETIVDRLRREKQMVGKQNALLRRQIKALAGRERRSRLEAQNLKMQIYRTSPGSKLLNADVISVSLQSKMAALQAQLSSTRRDNHNASITLWDKWKRAQQGAERWQARYEAKCQELRKAEYSLNVARAAVTRLEREKKVLLARLGEMRSERELVVANDAVEMDADDAPETPRWRRGQPAPPPPHVTAQALMDRVESQQRRIVALELADRGHDPLVTEYEKLLSQNTLLKGQILKLESQVLESQLHAGTSGLSQSSARHGELEHLRSYCEALKQENIQLSAKVCSLSAVEGGTHSSAAQRINDLEQTVLTLRGLVSKLQAEQKMSPKRGDMLRPGSGRSVSDQDRGHQELGKLRRSAVEKDHLLERSRDLLQMAAEREEELIKENTFLRSRLDGTTNS